MNYDSTDPDSDLFEKIPWMPYGERLAELFEQEEQEDVSYLLDRLAYLYENLGQYATAAKLKERALTIAEALFPPDHATVVVRQSNLALVYWNQGKQKEACDLWEQAHRIFLEAFGAEHPHTKTVKGFLDKYRKE